MTEPQFDSARFRQVLGHFPTGVCVVSALVGDEPVGLSIGSFFSVSLEPPLVGFCIGSASSTWPQIRDAGRFCVNVLRDDQEETSRAFASKGPDKFSGIGWDRSPLGSPRLSDALAWIDCEVFDTHGAGDHTIVVGAVHDLSIGREGRPLVFFRGGYTGIA
ncbi:MAG: flavin reductase [Acidimicrobiales bacterium]|nr:flavin reductase [Acidimicrobiales bacterium]